MQINDQIRDEAEVKASVTQMHLYASSEAGGMLRAIADKFGITNRTAYGIFAVTAGDVVLKLVAPNDLQNVLEARLPGLSQESAVGLTKAILDFAAPALTEASPAITQDLPKQNLATEITELENTVSHLEPMRTMASDMQQHQSTPAREVVHTSSQEALLEEEGPFDQPLRAPRWETENSQ